MTEDKNEKRRLAYQKNPEPIKESAREYYHDHIDEIHIKKKEYRANNKELISAANQKYYSEHKEESAKRSENRRMELKAKYSLLTKEQIYALTPLKICISCKNNLSSTEFYVDVTKTDGLMNTCKDCKRNKRK